MSRIINIDGVFDISLKKSRRAKNIILRINQKGEAVVTVPYYVPYYLAEKFILSRKDWLSENLKSKSVKKLSDGQKIGRSHILKFVLSSNGQIRSRVKENIITVSVASIDDIDAKAVQIEAIKAGERALRRQAEQHLPTLLHQLAKQYGYKYKEIRIKKMSTRWGSCSSNRIINLSIWLMQLPDDLIEYVCCHELAHLSHPHHQPGFWHELSSMIPDYKQRRKQMRQYRPALM